MAPPPPNFPKLDPVVLAQLGAFFLSLSGNTDNPAPMAPGPDPLRSPATSTANPSRNTERTPNSNCSTTTSTHNSASPTQRSFISATPSTSKASGSASTVGSTPILHSALAISPMTTTNTPSSQFQSLDADGAPPSTSGPPPRSASTDPETRPPPKLRLKRKASFSLETESGDVYNPFTIWYYEADLPITAKAITQYMGNIGLLAGITKTNLIKGIQVGKLEQPEKLVNGMRQVVYQVKEQFAEKIWRIMKTDNFWRNRRTRNEAVNGTEVSRFTGICRGINPEHYVISMFMEKIENLWFADGKDCYMEMVRNTLVVNEKGSGKRVFNFKDLLVDPHIEQSRAVYSEFTAIGRDLLTICAVAKGLPGDVFTKTKKK